jgi:hypothetical protein
MTGSVVRTMDVGVDPGTAFRVFTEEIDEWFARGPYSFNYPDRAVGLRFEPGVGGRWLELWSDGGGYEWGRITVWEPGHRFVVRYRHRSLPPEPLTEIEVRFEPGPTGGTTVTLEHRGWDALPPEALRAWAGRAWRQLMFGFADWADRRRQLARHRLRARA